MAAETRRVRLYSLAEFELPLPLNRALLLLVALNCIALSFEAALSHSPNEWVPRTQLIPVPWGPLGFVTSLWLAMRREPNRIAYGLHFAVMGLGIVIGVLGLAFHAHAAVRQDWNWLIYSAPLLAPLAFAGVSLVGILAALHEQPRGSGRLVIGGLGIAEAPITRHQQLLWLIALGFAITTLTVVFDHARQGGYVFGEWIAIAYGLFASVVAVGMALKRPENVTRADATTYVWVMLVGMLVGFAGVAFHIARDLGPGGIIVLERFIDFAPVLAPLLFTDLAVLGLIVAAEPVEVSERVEAPEPI